MIKMGAWVVSSPTEFAHYGVKGMRWGVRNEKQAIGRSSVRRKSLPKVSREYAEEKKYNNGYKLHSGTSLTSTTKKHSTTYSTDYKHHSAVSGIGGASKEYQKEFEFNSKKNDYQLSTIPNGTAGSVDQLDEEARLELEKKTIQKSRNLTVVTVSETKKDSAWKETVKKGADAVKKALDKAGQAIVSAGKKATEIVDKGKKALANILNIKPGPVKTVPWSDEKKKKNTVDVTYSYGSKTVTASPNASLSKIVKNLGGSTKGWKLKTK